MSILSGFKRFKDYLKTDNGYILTSRWTSSEAVEMSDGATLEDAMTDKTNNSDIINDLNTAVAVTDPETPLGCGVAKELYESMLLTVSFDESNGTLVTKSYDYTG